MEKEKMGIQADSTHESAPASSLESQSAEVERKARVDAVWEQMSKGVSVKTLKSVSVKCSSTVNKPTQKSSMSWMTYLGLAPKKAASPVQEKQPTPTPVHNGNSDEAKRLAAAALSAVKDAAASAATSGKGKVEDHLRRILRGQASLFDWSRSTSLARTLSPRVLESQIDAKKELEKSLKATCEEFIMSVTKLVVDPMLSFVTKVVMLGLDAAGKTTILYKLHIGEVLSTVPTIGFNVEKVQYKNVVFTVWDVGGQEKLRPLWRHYFNDTDGLIYVVDSLDRERIGKAKQEFQAIIRDPFMLNSVILVFANKQDMER